jgi:hypothetical protein
MTCRFHCGRHREGHVLFNKSWKKQLNGCLTTEVGDVRMMVEEVGSGFRVIVTRSGDETQPEKVLASASAANAGAAMSIAERMASRHSA